MVVPSSHATEEGSRCRFQVSKQRFRAAMSEEESRSTTPVPPSGRVERYGVTEITS